MARGEAVDRTQVDIEQIKTEVIEQVRVLG